MRECHLMSLESRTHFGLTLLFGIWLSACSVRAELEWAEREKAVNPLASEEKAVTTFSFTNRGRVPVKILVITSCCNCTSGTSDKEVYGPGESGTVTGTFAFGQRVGLHEKYLIVHTDDPKEPASVLTMRVQIPEMLTLSAGNLTWEIGEPLQAKVIHIQALSEAAIGQFRLSTSHPKFQAKVVQNEEKGRGREFDLMVTPSQGADSYSGAVNIEFLSKADNTNVFVVPLKVKR